MSWRKPWNDILKQKVVTVMVARRLLLLLLAGLALAISACQPSEPTPTPIPPRPTVIVVTASGPYYTPFDDAGDWVVGESSRSQGRVENGQYLLDITQPDYLAWTTQQRAFGDGVYEVDATLVSGPEASAYGLLFLGASDLKSFFYCVITGDGRYDVGYCEEGCDTQESLIGGLTLGYSILTGNQTNRLEVRLASGDLTFIINGTPVSEVRNLTYYDGLVGLIGESSPYGAFTAAFDNLRVTGSGDSSSP